MTELDKFKNILEEEKQKYEEDKIEFESNPLHWSNNKRRMAGMAPLRGKKNKYRVTKFRCFRPTPRVFFALEDTLNETIANGLKDNTYFNTFVDVKDINTGDKYEIQTR